MSRLFGTDGIRGVANRDLTPELAFEVGRAAAAVLARKVDIMQPVVVGRDTRVSGTMLEAAIVAGITSTGRNVIVLGVIPTPGVARITTAIDAAAGVMISASHNPIEDNGIKIFGPDGFKLTDAEEDEIQQSIGSTSLPRPTHLDVGMVSTSRGLADRYLFALVEASAELQGFTVVIDAAFGAAFEIGPHVFQRLGARVIAINAENDGSRINVDCGATNLEPLRAAVEAERARQGRRSAVVGVAFDGDADRAMFVDETGMTLTGDHTMLVLAREMQAKNELPGATVVGTVMSNAGLERALARDGIGLERAAVGDRYVLERMRASSFRLGGEQSGHIIDLSRNTTGDGLLTAVMLFSAAARAGNRLHDLAADLVEYPQTLVNVRVEGPKDEIVKRASVIEAVERAERELGGEGRILVRPSGTEPLVRIMLEGPDHPTIDRLAADIAKAVQAASVA
ncbi:MAG: phosphoglucosamine mutase [Vulcanimicrobiaceae bacterium]